MLNGHKFLMVLGIVVLTLGGGTTLTWAQRAKDVRLSDNDGDVLNINSDGTVPVSISGSLTFPSSAVFAAATIASDATTFSAASANIFVTSSNTVPTAVTDITGESNNQIVYIRGGSNNFGTSFNDSATFKLAGDVNVRLSLDDTLVLQASSDNTWVELSRANN